MQQTVRLLGGLGERYGSEHKYYDLRSPADAIKLLCINEPKFAKELAKAHESGVGYTLVQAGEFLDYGDLNLPLGQNDLVLTPVVAGSGGGGTGKILLGVALVAVAIVAAPLGAGFLGLGAGAFTSTTGVALVTGAATSFGVTAALSAASVAIGSLGLGLILQGTSQLLAPQPVIPKLNAGSRTNPGENVGATGPQGVSRATSGQQSYAFAGPANTVGVGATVPLVYGQLLIGSHLLSSKVDISDESDPTSSYFSDTGASSIIINGEKPEFKFNAHNGLRTRRYLGSHISYKNQDGANGKIKKIASDALEFGNTDVIDEVGIKEYDDDDYESKNLQVLLEIDKGLGRYLGNKIVPAYLTYEIAIKKENYDGKSPVFAKVRGTIQGLLTASQDYTWAHAITYGHSGTEDNDTQVVAKFRIIDTDANLNGGRIVVRGVGYNWFNQNSENDTTDLVTE
jgi:predicted phage tail protein